MLEHKKKMVSMKGLKKWKEVILSGDKEMETPTSSIGIPDVVGSSTIMACMEWVELARTGLLELVTKITQ
jgi:hypothetical protein